MKNSWFIKTKNGFFLLIFLLSFLVEIIIYFAFKINITKMLLGSFVMSLLITINRNYEK